MTQETMMTEATATPTEGAAASTEGAVVDQVSTAAPATEQQPEAKKPEGAPESYEFAFEEGKALDGDMLDDIKALAKDLDLPQDKAQKLADLALKRSDLARESQQVMLARAREEWASAARADKEFGGDALDANLATARKAMEAFGSPELSALLNESGLGNHPEIIRTFYRAGKAISDDTIIKGGSGASTNNDPRRLYPNSNMS